MRWRLCERILFVHDGESACLAPSTGLFFEVVPETEQCGENGILRTRVDGSPVALMGIGAGLALDLRRLCRIVPFMLQELGVAIGLEASRKLLGATPVVAPYDALKGLLLEHRIRGERLHFPGGWLEGATPRVMKMPDLSGVSSVVRLRLALPAPIDLFLLRDVWFGHVASSNGRYGPLACAGARIVREEYGGDLDADQLHELGLTCPPEVSPSPTSQELALMAVAAERLHGQEGADLLGYLIETLSPLPHSSDLDEGGRHTLAVLLNLKGAAERIDFPTAAIGTLDRALELAADSLVRQEIFYNRGYARLMTTVSPGMHIPLLVAEPMLWQTVFPRDPTAAQTATWRDALGDFKRAVELDDADETAWCQVGVANQLLGISSAAEASEERRALINAARDAFERAAVRSMNAEHRDVMRANAQAMARALESV